MQNVGKGGDRFSKLRGMLDLHRKTKKNGAQLKSLTKGKPRKEVKGSDCITIEGRVQLCRDRTPTIRS